MSSVLESVLDQLPRLGGEELKVVVEEATQLLTVSSEPEEIPPSSNRDELAMWYAQHYLSPRDFIREVVYLPADSPEWEIRLINVNKVRRLPLTDRVEFLNVSDSLEGVPPHTLLIADVSVEQWDRLLQGRVRLPDGWSLRNYRTFHLAQPET